MTAAFHAGFLQAACGVLKDPRSIPKRFISPVPTGDQSGSDWDNAAPLTAINAQIAIAAAAGGEVLLRADIGTYTRNGALTISNGGLSAGQPVVIRGASVGMADMMAEIVGGRADPWTVGAAAGNELFRLNSGADNLTWRFIRPRNQGRGAWRAREPISNLLLEDIEAFNVNTFFSNDPVTAVDDATVTGLTMRRVNVKGFSKTFCRLQSDTNTILFEDCVGDSDRQDRDNFASGIVFTGTAHDAIIRRCQMGNIIDTLNTYQNGDAFAGERGNSNILFEDCVAHNCTDGGWDLKGDGIHLVNCLSTENHRSFRMWGYAVLEDCISNEPIENAGANPYGKFHYSCFYNSMMELRNCRAQAATSGATVFTAETGAMLSYDSDCTWSVPSSAVVFLEEPTNNGDPAGKILAKPSVTGAPTITSPVAYSSPENVAAKWTMAANRPAQLRIVGGRDRKAFTTYGAELRMNRQDFESLADPNLQVDIQMKDFAGNVSNTQSLVVTVTDVADDPITPGELFGSGGATDGCWLEVTPGNCFQDAAGTIPCGDGDTIIRINDLSGKGNHAIAYNDAVAWTMHQESDRWYAECSGTDGACYKIGGNGDLSFAVATVVFAHRRDATVMPFNHLFTIPRYSTPQASDFRIRLYFNANSGTNFGGTVAGTSLYTNSTTASPTGKDAILSLRSSPALLRAQAIERVNGTDVPVVTYNGNGTSILGGRTTGDACMVGRFYGLIVTNREEGDSMNYRLERQLGLLASMNL